MAQKRNWCEESPPYSPEAEKQCPFPSSIQIIDRISRFFAKGQRYKSDMNDAQFDRRCDQFLDSLQLSMQQIFLLHEETVAHGDRWETERRKRLTDSSFGRVFKMKNETPPSILVKELLPAIYSKESYGYQFNNVMDGGENDQYQAIAQYESLNQQNVHLCGLIVHREIGYLAASPTALVQENGNFGILEIKCPSYAVLMQPLEIPQYIDHFYCTLSEDRSRMTLNTDHCYYYQIQGQLEITDRAYCDFVIWTPRGMHVERIWRDRSVWEMILPKLESFYKLSLLPEIVDSRLKRQLPIREPDFVLEAIEISRKSKLLTT